MNAHPEIAPGGKRHAQRKERVSPIASTGLSRAVHRLPPFTAPLLTDLDLDPLSFGAFRLGQGDPRHTAFVVSLRVVRIDFTWEAQGVGESAVAPLVVAVAATPRGTPRRPCSVGSGTQY